MLEVQSENLPEIQYLVLQNEAKTHHVYCDGALSGIEQKLRQAFKHSCHKITSFNNYNFIGICHIVTNMMLNIKSSTATETTLH